MDTKQYLKQIKRLDSQIQNKLLEIYQFKSMVFGATKLNDIERVQTSADKDKLGWLATTIVDMENEANELINERYLIVSQIESINDADAYDVLARKYILGEDLKVIAIDRNVTYRHIKSLHASAIKIFEKKYGDLYADK